MTKLYEYDSTKNPNFKVYIIAFIIQLIITTILSINSKNKRRLAKVTMINKLVQIPYFIFFFLFSIMAVMVGMGLMGIGLIFIPFLIAIDFGVFLSTVIPEEACTIRLYTEKHITFGSFLFYIIGNFIYVLDIILSVMIFKDFKRGEERSNMAASQMSGPYMQPNAHYVPQPTQQFNSQYNPQYNTQYNPQPNPDYNQQNSQQYYQYNSQNDQNMNNLQ